MMKYYLSLGSNLGDREQTIQQALGMIEQQIGHVLRCSSYYYSAPWGFASTNSFCNICCCVESEMSPLGLLGATQAIERALGRTHKSQNGQYQDRTIDIDIILAFEGERPLEWQSAELQIPHPLWAERDFVKVPLEEIMQ